MTTLVSNAYIVMPQLDRVRGTATELSSQGYAVSYALQAFDDMEGALRRQSILAWSALGCLGLGACAYFVTTWRSFMRLSRRDVGTLVHWQVPTSAVAGIYRRRVLRSAVTLWLATLTGHGMIGAPLLGPTTALRSTALIAAVAAPILALLCWVVDRVAIAPVPREEPLDLLKRGREFQ